MAADPKILKIFQLESLLKQKDTEINRLKAELELANVDIQNMKIKAVVETIVPEKVKVEKPIKKKAKTNKKPPMFICEHCNPPKELYVMHKANHMRKHHPEVTDA